MDQFRKMQNDELSIIDNYCERNKGHIQKMNEADITKRIIIR